MKTIKGKYATAVIYTDNIEQEALNQIAAMMDSPASEGCKVRIMPDVHAGKDCVIGYTSTVKASSKVSPSWIGCDIGCGVTVMKLDKRMSIAELDRNASSIAAGKGAVNKKPLWEDSAWVHTEEFWNTGEFWEEIEELCTRVGADYSYVQRSLGSLGGGNHFLESDIDESGSQWLAVHSGSRNLGQKVFDYYSRLARERGGKDARMQQVLELKRKYSGAELGERIKALPPAVEGSGYLEGVSLATYRYDCTLVKEYAHHNRSLLLSMLSGGKVGFCIESVHNYITGSWIFDGMIRKGAISADEGNHVVIPLNMRDGILLGCGKGNEDWNYSAPHGAGRSMSRAGARKAITLEAFRQSMEGIHSTTVSEETVDEAPMAYKPAEEIIELIKPTVAVYSRLKPIWNFKGAD